MTTHRSTYLKNHIVKSIANTRDFYVFASRHRDASIDSPEDVANSLKETFIDPYREMIFGKRVTDDDTRLCIRWIPHEEKVFDMWDDEDVDMLSKDFYTIVNEGSWYHVYKCLDNNQESNSTAIPSFTHISGANTNFYKTSDGYKWKYMFSVDETIYNDFASENYFPVVPNTDVQNSAEDGVIDVVKIDNGGRRYDNYFDGVFTASQIRVNGNTLLYQVSANNLNTSNGFYTGCVLYVKSGTGAGQFQTVVDYFSNSEASFVVLQNSFSIAITNGSEYEVRPEVLITGDGTETVNARARALVNVLATNAISEVEILERGLNYNFAEAEPVANVEVGVTRTADLRPIISPRFGHGFDPFYELGANTVCIRSRFSNNELGSIPANNTFDQVGLLDGPQFDNVFMDLSNVHGTFSNNERLVRLNPVKINEGVETTDESVVVTCEAGDFQNQLDIGDYVYLSDNLENHQLESVATIDNSSSLNVSSVVGFTSSNVKMFKNEIEGTATVSLQVNASRIECTNVVPEFSTGDDVIGETSGAKATINSIVRAAETKEFDTFVGLYKYDVELISGEFQEDENIFVGSSLEEANSKAVFHSVEETNSNIWLRTSNQVGSFSEGDTVSGEVSLATAIINTIYEPEIVFGSGRIHFLRNIETVTRADDASEDIKLYFEI